ncbi:MAG: PEP-CTERM sorting domain-containing protein [bacterium]
MKRFFLWISAVLLVVGFVGTSYATTFINGSFEDSGILTGWTHNGIVSQVTSGTVSFDGISYDITAVDGNSMALLSSPGLSGGGSYTNNWISQDIPNFQGGTISFYYNMFSTDGYGNDRFMVNFYDESGSEIINARLELDELTGAPYSYDPTDPYYGLYYSGWQQYSHDFGVYATPFTLSIKLSAGNGVDDSANTWTYLDDFQPSSSQSAVPLPGTIFLLGFGLLGLIECKRRGLKA